MDDNDLFCAGKTATTSGEALSPDFQFCLYRRTGGLIATGVSIAAEKSFCYLIDFIWNGSSWEYQKVEHLPGEFSIQNKEGIQETLKRYEVSHADKTLAVFIAMDGNEEAEIEHLKKMSESFCHQLRTVKCEKNASMYNSVLFSTPS